MYPRQHRTCRSHIAATAAARPRAILLGPAQHLKLLLYTMQLRLRGLRVAARLRGGGSGGGARLLMRRLMPPLRLRGGLAHRLNLLTLRLQLLLAGTPPGLVWRGGWAFGVDARGGCMVGSQVGAIRIAVV